MLTILIALTAMFIVTFVHNDYMMNGVYEDDGDKTKSRNKVAD